MKYKNEKISDKHNKIKSIFIASNFVQETEDGNVSQHQAQALADITKLERVITDLDIMRKYSTTPIEARSFLMDYFVAHELRNYKFDLAFFNGAPFGMTTHVLKPAKTIVSITAHNIELSNEECKAKNGYDSFPFDGLTDKQLLNSYFQHISDADVVICPSKLSANYLSTRLQLKNSMAVIPYGCFFPEEIQVKSTEDFSIAHVGANTSNRGQLYLIRAWHKLKLTPRFKGNMVIVGPGTGFWRPFGVFSSEHLTNCEKVYNDCSVYVQPSVTEGFGVQVLEAMAHARPVIVTEGV
ncbi:MAG: glycosyltransferase family 4 protein, partial [Candidatus Bathyarchaeia archaeon]